MCVSCASKLLPAALACAAACAGHCQDRHPRPYGVPRKGEPLGGAELTRATNQTAAGGIRSGARRSHVELVLVDTNRSIPSPSEPNAMIGATNPLSTMPTVVICVFLVRGGAPAMQEVAMDKTKALPGRVGRWTQARRQLEIATTGTNTVPRLALNSPARWSRRSSPARHHRCQYPRLAAQGDAQGAILAEKCPLDASHRGRRAGEPAHMKMEVVGLWQPSATATRR